MKILHLEDNPRDAELVRESLREEWPDCEIETVDRKDDYLAGLERGCDVILSDFSLINFNGLEALALARNKVPEKPFIFLSGTIGEERALEALRAGAADYVLKDRPRRLVPALRRALKDVDLQRERERTHEQLAKIQRLENLGMLAAGIAHDFNNVLTPILLGVSLLKKNRAPSEAKILATMEASAHRGAQLVGQILNFTHATTGEAQLIQPNHILKELAGMIRQTFQKTIVVESVLPSDLWLIRVNPTQFYQVVLNLCVNARDAMPAGGTLSLIARNETQNDERWVCLEIADTGSGIPASLLEKIWEPFFTTKSAGSGTGLGLAIVKGIVSDHGGSVHAHSRPGHGTTFKLLFPAQPGSERLGVDAADETPRGNGELVLVVDDDPGIRDFIGTLLGRHGYQTISAQDGAEALALFAPRQFEIKAVVTDLDMPHLNGASLCAVLRRLSPVLPVVIVSGSNPANQRAADAHLRFVAKPFSPAHLLRTLGELVNTERR